MLTFDGNVIYLTRGDTAKIDLQITDPEQENYDFSEDDVIFSLKHYVVDEKILIQKKFEDYDSATGKASIELAPEDTADLQFGDYIYDVRLTHTETGESGDVVNVCTVIPPTRFTIGAQVTTRVL